MHERSDKLDLISEIMERDEGKEGHVLEVVGQVPLEHEHLLHKPSHLFLDWVHHQAQDFSNFELVDLLARLPAVLEQELPSAEFVGDGMLVLASKFLLPP